MASIAPIRATTQEHLDIEDVTNNVVILKDGSCALVLKVNAVNFALLSEEEQDAIIYTYAGLINSLSFPVQILIRSQKKDITDYLNLLQTQESKQTDPVMKSRINAYREFVSKLVKERNVLDKSFYAVIPFSSTELGIKSSGLSPIQKRPEKLPYEKSYIVQKALSILEPKRDHLIRQFNRLGLIAKQLNTQELIQLLYVIYNPDASEGIQTVESHQYQSPIIQTNHQFTTPPSQTDEAQAPK